MLPKKLLRPEILIPAAGLAGLAFIALCALVWVNRDAWIPGLDGWVSTIAATISGNPLVFFIAMTVLPTFAVPQSLFFITLGTVFGESPWINFGFGCIALIGNITFSYYLVAVVCRPAARRIAERFGYKIPEIGREDTVQLTLAFRITPGLPYFVQNILLGLGGVPFLPYLVVSFLTQVGWMAAFVFLGRAVVEGSAGKIVLAVMLIVALSIFMKVLRRKVGNAKALKQEPEEAHAPGT